VVKTALIPLVTFTPAAALRFDGLDVRDLSPEVQQLIRDAAKQIADEQDAIAIAQTRLEQHPKK
jgi:hypothetical protein